MNKVFAGAPIIDKIKYYQNIFTCTSSFLDIPLSATCHRPHIASWYPLPLRCNQLALVRWLRIKDDVFLYQSSRLYSRTLTHKPQLTNLNSQTYFIFNHDTIWSTVSTMPLPYEEWNRALTLRRKATSPISSPKNAKTMSLASNDLATNDTNLWAPLPLYSHLVPYLSFLTSHSVRRM